MAQTVDEFFSSLEDKIDQSKTAGMNATFQFSIAGETGGEWNVRVVEGVPTVSSGTAEDADITIAMDASHWTDLVEGRLSGQSAFLTGKLKLRGDIALAMKLQSLLG